MGPRVNGMLMLMNERSLAQDKNKPDHTTKDACDFIFTVKTTT